jgi:hypothetical protein
MSRGGQKIGVVGVLDAARHDALRDKKLRGLLLLHGGWRAGVSGQKPTSNAWKAWKICPMAEKPCFYLL